MQQPHAYFYARGDSRFYRAHWMARSEPRAWSQDAWFINTPIGFGRTTPNGVTIHLYGAPL